MSLKIDELKEMIEDFFGIEQLQIKSRKPRIIKIRWIFYLIARDLKLGTLEEIGMRVNLDHATVLYGYRKGVNALETDSEFYTDYTRFNDYLNYYLNNYKNDYQDNFENVVKILKKMKIPFKIEKLTPQGLRIQIEFNHRQEYKSLEVPIRDITIPNTEITGSIIGEVIN